MATKLAVPSDSVCVVSVPSLTSAPTMGLSLELTTFMDTIWSDCNSAPSSEPSLDGAGARVTVAGGVDEAPATVVVFAPLDLPLDDVVPPPLLGTPPDGGGVVTTGPLNVNVAPL